MFAEHLPRLAAVMRSTWKPALQGLEPIRAPEGEPADVLGHAISERLVWNRSPLSSPLLGATQLVHAGASPTVVAELDSLAQRQAPENTDNAARAAVLIGLLDRACRTGSALAEPWYDPLMAVTTLHEVLAAVPDAWVADVRAVTGLSGPALASRQGP